MIHSERRSHEHHSREHHSHEHQHNEHHSSEHQHNEHHSSEHHHHSEIEPSLVEKFSIILKHWIEHNNSHKQSYLSWVDKAESDKSGNINLEKAVQCLKQTAELSEKITEHLENALKSISKPDSMK